MAIHQSPDVDRIISDVRRTAAGLPFDERARLIRGVTHAVREAIKTDVSTGGAPKGRAWELDQLAPINDAAENHYFTALDERR
ncbi:hypothetical protein [Demequina litorisediminis]|uniref:Uncharacterized protein n=1 Tax=Demequina litorisediminis TaxID=1849022 RepID=A0ABQ6IL83_9MICO|nr:hypothetical protein [Demequina litorisediminis]GMA37788.1 hypothetical protein GCM10025876_39920 [Demequina litorisediminis]GMA37848.1 hypothetical protein GCM10025876_40520 [Demequina litorisediminis]GMA37891.1 hypothetical protein GCM10025876_40950 [Demequina litorisediminis]GMA37948.1 hypothetical protein GCM10025876_41520 [Demequina litorisediminis]